MIREYKTKNIEFIFKNNDNKIEYRPFLTLANDKPYCFTFKPLINGQLYNDTDYFAEVDMTTLTEQDIKLLNADMECKANDIFALLGSQYTTKELSFCFSIGNNVIEFVPAESTINNKFYTWTFTPIINNNDLMTADYVIDNMCDADVKAIKEDYYVDVQKDTLETEEYNQLENKLKQVAKDLCNSIFNAKGKLMYDDVNDRFIEYNNLYDANGCLIGA